MLTGWWWVHEARGMCTCRAHDPFAPRRCQESLWERLWRTVSHYQERVIERLERRLADERQRRQDELRIMATAHAAIVALAETRRLDANSLSEQRRVDANRAADLAAVVLSNTRAELTAAALAERVDTTQKTLAIQVEQTKVAAGLAVDATTATLGSRIKPLEDARYEQAGRSGGRTDVTKVLWALLGAGIPIILWIVTHTGIVTP